MAGNLIHLPLGPLDHFAPRTYPGGVLYLKLKNGVTAQEAFKDLQEGLRRTIQQLPWLGGKVHWQSNDSPGWRPGQLEIRHLPVAAAEAVDAAPYQLRYNELDTAPAYADMKARGFPIDSVRDEELLWAPFRADIDAGAEVFVAQANFIPGACLLASSIIHVASDATAMFTVLGVWSQHCSYLHSSDERPKAALSDMPVQVTSESSDRTLLGKIWQKERSGRSIEQIDAGVWQLVGLESPKAEVASEQHGEGVARDKTGPQSLPPAMFPATNEPEKTMTSKVFYISPRSFAAMKKAANEELGGTEVSGNDLILALMWRGLMKARSAALQASSEDQNRGVEIQIPVDGRPDFSQNGALPVTYLGNLNFHYRPSMVLGDLLAPSTSLPAVAKRVRSCGLHVHHDNMLDAYTLLDNLPDFRATQPLRFLDFDGTLLISSMLMVSDDLCFGARGPFANAGRPEGYRPMMSTRNLLKFRLCYVFPRKPHGGIEFMVSLMKDELEFLLKDEEFGRYALLLA
ncbi:uncharacterized protein B0I36DRAFT_350756 [Microdochium trichocladiopsis]|uniref:Trichothecene 3-O-acetyltransferase-like N-terminal domain-containing protein n=1 Tax=Microdochium trichocladiopsis TaxID=1682393 RepID=A0A9P9BRD5_9PEZI|nr:uncharacterized protein B0I36DRAFT_350756 [Microdochium trichocladiopsis]KAH7027190.1 hypothetical protein B0I36DRAFT_350756 [Microdochium trichocladiopsis]